MAILDWNVLLEQELRERGLLEQRLLERRDFLQRIAWTGCLALGGAGLLVACSDEDGGSGGSGSAGSGDMDCSNGAQVVYINQNHAHAVSALSAAEITAAVPQNYTLLSGGHIHSFPLSAADFQTLIALGTVTVTSIFPTDHFHDIQISC